MCLFGMALASSYACATSEIDELGPARAAPKDGGATSRDGGPVIQGDGGPALQCPRDVGCLATLQVSTGGTYQAIGGAAAAILEHSCVAKKGELFCWGDNAAGQVGNGATTDPDAPVKVLDRVHQVSAGGAYSCAVRTDGGLWCWGSNTHEQLGGATSNPLLPAQVLSDVVQVSTGDTHTCAVKANGSLWCWGANGAGQANPVSTSTTISAPVEIGVDFTEVSAGYAHTCGLKTDRSLWCWGANSNAQLGIGKTSAKEPMTRVASIASNVATGANISAFVDDSGALRVMGEGTFGQLGLGTTTKVLSPTLVPGLTRVTDVAIGARGYHTCAIADGGMYCWGWFAGFPKGTSTVSGTNVSAPYKLATDAVTVSTARVHSCYTRASGEVLCWGDANSVAPGAGSTSYNAPSVIAIP